MQQTVNKSKDEERKVTQFGQDGQAILHGENIETEGAKNT